MNETAIMTAIPEDALVSEQVTYLPAKDDPSQVKFAGHTFHANLPLTVSIKSSLMERLRANPWFKVGAFDPAKDAVKVKPSLASPKTPEQYRAHAVNWIKTAQSVEELDTRWAKEETLRMSCGVGADDIDYLASLYRPKRADLRKREQP